MENQNGVMSAGAEEVNSSGLKGNKDELDQRIGRLRIFNIVMAFLHAIQGGFMLWVSNDYTLPITSSFVEFNPMAQQLEPVLEYLADVRIGPLVAGFLFLSAAAHAIISLPGVFEWYRRNLKKGANYARWIEYALSSSLMIWVIAMLAGIYDVLTLTAIFGLNASMILFGWLMELHNQTTKKTNWTSFIFGSMFGLVPWVLIALSLWGAGGETGGPPTFVYWIFFSMFIFFNTFAINMILQYKKVGPWRDYLFGEKVYIILSLVAKSLLAWQVWAGTLAPF